MTHFCTSIFRFVRGKHTVKKTAKVGGERRGREGRGKEEKGDLVNCKEVVGTHGEGRRAGFASEQRNTCKGGGLIL